MSARGRLSDEAIRGMCGATANKYTSATAGVKKIEVGSKRTICMRGMCVHTKGRENILTASFRKGWKDGSGRK